MEQLEVSEDFSARPKELAEEMAKSIPKNFQEAFGRVITAGMRIMFSEQTHDMMMEQLDQDGDLAQVVGEGMAGLMLLMYQKSNQTMPGEIIVPAAIYLLAEGADFLEKVIGEEIPPDVIGDAIEVMLNILMEKFGIDPQKFQMAIQKAAQGGYQ